MDAGPSLPPLNALTGLCLDGALAFAYGAKRACQPRLRALFHRRHADCLAAALAWQRLVMQHGGEPRRQASDMTAMQLDCLAVRCALTDDPDAVLMDACETGDQLVLRWYQALLLRPWPAPVQALLVAQQAVVEGERTALAQCRDIAERLS